MTIVVHGFGPAFGLADVSPFTVKAMMLLAMAGLPFERRRSDPRRAPKGKLPYLEDDGTIVADTSFIRAHIESKHGFDFDAGLGPVERGVAWAFEKMMEEQFYFAVVHARWIDEESFARGPRQLFGDLPAPLRPLVSGLVRRKVRRQLHEQGMGRHTQQEITGLAKRALDALSARLGDKPFLTGDRPCGADAGIAAQLAGAACRHFDSELSVLTRSYPLLVAYGERMTSRYLTG